VTKTKRWFAARLLAEILHPTEPNAVTLFEESVVLVRARDSAEASRRAKEIGSKAETEYLNPDGDSVHWAFREVLEVQELLDDEIADGTEVYRALLRADEVEERRRAMKRFEEPIAAQS
jgi:hypothetical protein